MKNPTAPATTSQLYALYHMSRNLGLVQKGESKGFVEALQEKNMTMQQASDNIKELKGKVVSGKKANKKAKKQPQGKGNKSVAMIKAETELLNAKIKAKEMGLI